MPDRINNNISESIIQNSNLEKLQNINKLGISNPFEEDSGSYFIDESVISDLALSKYQKELDVQKFSDILKDLDQNEADSLVLSKAFDGGLTIDGDNFLEELIDNKDFLDAIFKDL